MSNPKICLFMPPGWDITQPYLSLPLLKGYTNSLGYDIDIFDDNIFFYDNILSSNYIQDKLELVCNEFILMDKGIIPFTEEYNNLRLIKIYEKYLINIDKCKKILRLTENPDEYKFNMRVIYAALATIGHCFNMDLTPNTISSKIYNSKSINELLNFVFDIKNNVFYEYYSIGDGTKVINKALNYDHIGLSIVSRQQLLSALTFSSIIKKEKNPPIIHFGGNYITRLAMNVNEKTLLKLLNIIDFIMLYEGEIALKQVLDGINYYKCQNVIYKYNDCLYKNELKKYIPRNYIVPNFDGMDLNLYFSAHLSLPMISSKGCYSKCSFCTIPQGNSNNKYHIFNIKDIVNAIVQLKEKYHTSYFTFNDETFNIKKMVDFANELSASNIKIKWIAETRFDEKISDMEFNKIVDSGCSFLEFGLESYNQRVLDLMNKNIKIENIDYILNQCIKYKLPVHLFAIFGFPGEKIEEIQNTQKFILNYLDLAKNNGIIHTSTGFGSFGLECGSYVYKNPEQFNIHILNNEDDSIDLEHKYTVSNGIKPLDIKKIVDEFTYSIICGYPDSLPQSFVMFSSNNKIEFSPYIDDIFTDNFNINGLKCEYNYMYNFEKQWLIPINNKKHIDGLLKIYGHSKIDNFNPYLQYSLNPIILFQDNISDPIRNIQFNIPKNIYNTLLNIRKYGYKGCIDKAIRDGKYDEVINQIYKLYSAGLIINEST